MKKLTKPFLVSAVALVLISGATPASAAEESDNSTTTTAVSPKSGVRRAQVRAVIEAIREYRQDFKAFVQSGKSGATPEYRAALKSYAQARRTIEIAFRDALKSASGVRKAAVQADSSNASRQAARAAFAQSIEDAKAARQQALEDLGTPPAKS